MGLSAVTDNQSLLQGPGIHSSLDASVRDGKLRCALAGHQLKKNPIIIILGLHLSKDNMQLLCYFRFLFLWIL